MDFHTIVARQALEQIDFRNDVCLDFWNENAQINTAKL